MKYHEHKSVLELTYGAVKALTVVVVVEGLYPPVSGLDGKPTRNTLGREQLVPI